MGLLEHAQLKKKKGNTNKEQTFKILFCNKKQPNK